VCDFEPDCPDASDERSCPREANFEACETEMGSPMCGFQEDPVDNLDWILASGKHSVVVDFLEGITYFFTKGQCTL